MAAGIIVVMGPTGAGKSVQAGLLAQRVQGVHFSSGALLRQDKAVANVLAAGALVSNQEVERVISSAIQGTALNKDIVLDGFPRTVQQAEWLERGMVQWKRQLTKVILVVVSESVAERRLAGRGRSDDTTAAQREKRLEYETATRPVIDYYRSRGLLVEVDGEQPVETVADEIRSVVA